MLFYLNYTPHDVEKLYDLLVFFFNKVETENPTTFDIATLFPAWYSNKNAKNKIQRLDTLEKQLTKFITFEKVIRDEIISAFREANEIELLFSDKNKHIPIAKYFEKYIKKDINDKGKEITILYITDFLDELFVELYTTQLGNKNSTFSQKINTNLTEHYIELEKQNTAYKGSFMVCPFCGLENYKMIESEGRPDYDHILPKGDSLFVFSSINLKNLFPIGLICNKLKETSHLLYEDKTRTKRTIAFYPYDASTNPFELVDFHLTCISKPSLRIEGKWEVAIQPKNNTGIILQEKITTWNRVFKIQNRYAEYIRKKSNNLIEIVIEACKEQTNILSEVIKEIDGKINKYLELKYSLIANNIGLIPERLFYKWALQEQKFIESFVNAYHLFHKVNISSDCE